MATTKEAALQKSELKPKNDNENLKPYTLYTPQGRTIRITLKSLEKNINAALVNNFSFCHMIILIGKNGISVTHADIAVSTTDIENEINWLGKDCQKILIYRPEEQKRFLSEHSQQEMLENSDRFIYYIWSSKGLTNNSNWQRKPVDSNVNHLLIHPERKPSSNIHENVSVLTAAQLLEHNLLNHPNERDFMLAHKIEETFFCNSLDLPAKKALIFDGEHWLPIPNNELEACHSDFTFKKRLHEVIGNRKFMDIAGRLHQARRELIMRNYNSVKLMDQTPDLAMKVAKYYQDYQCKDSPVIIFLRDIQEIWGNYVTTQKNITEISQTNPAILTQGIGKPITNDKDQDFVRSLKKFLKQSSFSRIEKLISDYEKSSHQSPFKGYIIDNYKAAKENYLERMQLVNVIKLYESQNERIKELGKKVTAIWLSKDYAGAYPILHEMMSLSLCYVKSSPDLIKLLGNMGTCLCYLKRYQEAKPFLEQTIYLRETYGILLEEIPKFKQKLQECNNHFDSKETKTSSETLALSKSNNDASSASSNERDPDLLLNQFKLNEEATKAKGVTNTVAKAPQKNLSS